jgi:hypothetical protein
MHKYKMKHSYLAYGFIIHSDLLLPELVSFEGMADVVIRLGDFHLSPSKAASEGVDFRVTNEGVFLFWKNEGKFFVRGGKEIVIDPFPGVDERVLRLIVLGPALATALHQRGRLALHAATVEIDGKAVCFMGGPGCGKSALAATLYKRGHAVVADDVTAVQINGAGGPLVFPGFPQLKLWPEVIASLGDDPVKLGYLEPGTEKRSFPITSSFSEKPLPLGQIYILNEKHTNEITPLLPQEALLELMRHTYRASLLKWIGAERHLSQCASLVNNVPISRLNRPLSLSALPHVAGMVEENLTHS